MNRSYSKLRHIQESNILLEQRINKQQVSKNPNLSGGNITPADVEEFFYNKIDKLLGVWTTVDDLKKLYSLLLPLSGKKVTGKSVCFVENHHNNGNVNTTVINCLNSLNEWAMQSKCRNESGPSQRTLIYEVYQVGTVTLGKEGKMLKTQIIDLMKKNGASLPSYVK